MIYNVFVLVHNVNIFSVGFLIVLEDYTISWWKSDVNILTIHIGKFTEVFLVVLQVIKEAIVIYFYLCLYSVYQLPILFKIVIAFFSGVNKTTNVIKVNLLSVLSDVFG